jgi:hypothetical protein
MNDMQREGPVGSLGNAAWLVRSEQRRISRVTPADTKKPRCTGRFVDSAL